jgi:hypothetical protein
MLLFALAKTSHLNWFPVGTKNLCFPTFLSTRDDIVMLTGQGLEIHMVSCKCTYITGGDLELCLIGNHDNYGVKTGYLSLLIAPNIVQL